MNFQVDLVIDVDIHDCHFDLADDTDMLEDMAYSYLNEYLQISGFDIFCNHFEIQTLEVG